MSGDFPGRALNGQMVRSSADIQIRPILRTVIPAKAGIQCATALSVLN